jgi:tetraprenyl-beta-curcumene synthase
LAALALANARYWSSTAGAARAQLRHWRERAERIDDPAMRALALAKLRDEGFNAQAAAVLATVAPRPYRLETVRAIVALELLFDCLDGFTEDLAGDDPVGAGERLFEPFVAAVDPGRGTVGVFSLEQNNRAKGGVKGGVGASEYLQELSETVREAVATLPAFAAVAPVAHECALRTAQAQVRMHAATQIGRPQLAEWGRARARGGQLGWREYLASSAAAVLTQHALIAAACDPRTSTADARRIDRAYMSVCAVVTLLDCVVDQSADEQEGKLAYITLYEDRELLALALAQTAADAARRCAALPTGAHHLMTLAGGIAYWASDPAAREQPAAATIAPLRRELRALIAPPMLVMRAWRAAKRGKAAWLRSQRTWAYRMTGSTTQPSPSCRDRTRSLGRFPRSRGSK